MFVSSYHNDDGDDDGEDNDDDDDDNIMNHRLTVFNSVGYEPINFDFLFNYYFFNGFFH